MKRYPKLPNVYDSFGDAFENNKQKKLAIQNYKKAYELGKSIDDPYTSIYLKNLKRVQKE